MKFNHKGLQALFEKDDARRVRADQVERIKHILLLLDAAKAPASINSRPGFRLHPLMAWSLIQVSASLHPRRSSDSAMAGVIPCLPLSIRDKVVRDKPSRLAHSATVQPIASMS